MPRTGSSTTTLLPPPPLLPSLPSTYHTHSLTLHHAPTTLTCPRSARPPNTAASPLHGPSQPIPRGFVLYLYRCRPAVDGVLGQSRTSSICKLDAQAGAAKAGANQAGRDGDATDWRGGCGWETGRVELNGTGEENGPLGLSMRQLVGQLVVRAGTHRGTTADEDRAPWQTQCGDKLEMSRFDCWSGALVALHRPCWWVGVLVLVW